MAFFGKVTKEEWEEKHQKNAVKYDNNEQAHLTALDMPLTGEVLQKIAEELKSKEKKNSPGRPTK